MPAAPWAAHPDPAPDGRPSTPWRPGHGRSPAAARLTRQQAGSCSHDGSNSAGLTVKVIVDLCVVPIGVGVHLAPYIAACERVLTEAGLKIQLHPNGTAIEGEWEPVFAAIEACHQALHAMGCPRVYTTVKINTRTDKDQTLEDKVASVQALLCCPARGSKQRRSWPSGSPKSDRASGSPRTRPSTRCCGTASLGSPARRSPVSLRPGGLRPAPPWRWCCCSTSSLGRSGGTPPWLSRAIPRPWR